MKALVRAVLSLYIIIIFVQSLFYKFTGAPETVYIFSTIGDWIGSDLFAQYGSKSVGVVELIAASMLLFGFRFEGALLAAGTMACAVFFHLFTPLGIDMPEFNAEGMVIGYDGGLLFYNICGVLISAVIILLMELYD